MIDIEQIHLSEPFTEIFPVDNKTLQSIRSNIEQNGYDEAEPLIVWKRNGKLLCVDGHTRLMAAQSLGIEEIPVIEKDFQNEDDAVSYAIHRQRDRRNLTDAELWKCIQWMDKRQPRSEDGRFKPAAQDCAPVERSSQQTAQALGISARKVEQARTVMDHGDETTKQAIEKGGMSINKAYQQTQRERVDIGNKNKKPESQIQRKEEIIDAECQRSFDAFYREIQRSRLANWETTSKESCLKMLKLLNDLITIA